VAAAVARQTAERLVALRQHGVGKSMASSIVSKQRHEGINGSSGISMASAKIISIEKRNRQHQRRKRQRRAWQHSGENNNGGKRAPASS